MLLRIVSLTALSSALFAQATDTIYGTVADASGAVIPSAQVSITNTGTNQTRYVAADEGGQYVAPLLPVGNYSVRIEKTGFAAFVQTAVALQANTNVQVNGQLEVRAASEQVTVSATPTLVQAAATTLVQVVDERRIVDLPLNGRNVLQLMSLNAGVSDSNSAGGTRQINTIAGGGYAYPVSINGSRGNATNFVLDNASNNDGYTNISEPYPNPDAVQEFSLQTSTFDAQYGRGVGGVVNVVTRSGTNQLHGTAFDFLRNYQMNAANFFSGRDTIKRNQFGFTVGGPLELPKLYNGRNRTFFFGSYQGTRTATASPGALRTAPSDAMKTGDFSAWLRPDGTGRIHDPNTANGYFPNNQIPRSLFDPVSAKLLNYMPSSTDPSYLLRFGTPSQYTNEDQMMLRGDHNISDKQRISLRYFFLRYDQPWQFLPGNLLFVNAGQFGNAHNATINHSYTFSPRLLSDLNLTFHRSTPKAAPPADLDISFGQLGGNIKSIPGFRTMDVGITNWSGISLALGYFSPQTTYQLSETISYATGKHNLRFGGDVRRYVLDIASYWLSGGTASFSGQLLSDPGKANAGNSFAEFLLGRVGSWRQQSFSSWTLYNWYAALFVQDDIRLNNRLTLNMGMRWDPKTDYRESSRKRTTFIPGRQSQVYPNAPLGLLFQGDAGFENKIIPADLNNFAPRVGLAYQLYPKTVIRAAYGIFYDQNAAIIDNRSAQGEPFVTQVSLAATNSLVNIYGSDPPLDPSPVVPGKDFVFHPYGTWAVPSRDMRTGYMQNWNFIVEQQLGGSLLLRAGYVGSKGTRLLDTAEINPAIFGPGATAANVNQRRIYQPIGGLQLGMSNSWSKYNSMQVTVQKRYSHGFTVLANYTWSKSIDITSYGSVEGNNIGPDPFNYNNNRGVSDFDVPHRLVLSGVWEHPHFTGQNAVVRGVLGGWQSNFIYTAVSGSPMTIASGVDNALMGIGGNRADFTGAALTLPGGRSQAERIQKWFNTAAFQVNAIGTIGASGRNILPAPGGWNADYSLFKNFRLVERAKLQFRGEFFNVFNHTRLGAPNTTVTSQTFGRITSANSPRIVQFALKLVF
jgi:outer membrane receptor protein involved in Fe transport